MKKIAEVQIGSNLPDDYRYSGSPTAFVMQTSKDTYYGVCNVCGTHFTCNYLYNEAQVSCPSCGKQHRYNEIMVCHDKEGIGKGQMPYSLRMSVIDFKEKVELRLVYKAVVLDAEKLCALFKNVKETFTYYCNEQRATWRYEAGQENPVEYEIGYLADYSMLYEKTALSFFAFDHKTKKGTFTEVLKKLRDAINKHMQSMGYSKKTLYVSNDLKRKLYASVLAIAHKVRFWDAELPYKFYGLSYNTWKNLILKAGYLPDAWEKSIEEGVKKGMTYHKALASVLSIPYTPMVRKYMRYENLFILRQAFSLPYDIGIALLPYFMSMQVLRKDSIARFQDNHQEILDITDFFHIFYSKYKKVMHVHNVMKHWDFKYADVLSLYRQADAVTKEKFDKEAIPLKHLHDWLSVEIIAQNDRECIFDIKDTIKKALQKVIDKYTFKCVEKKSELKNIALQLHNCSAGYANRVGNRIQLVVVKEDTHILALLEITDRKIVQAKLVNNREVSESEEINKACCAYSSITNMPCMTTDISA